MITHTEPPPTLQGRIRIIIVRDSNRDGKLDTKRNEPGAYVVYVKCRQPLSFIPGAAHRIPVPITDKAFYLGLVLVYHPGVGCPPTLKIALDDSDYSALVEQVRIGTCRYFMPMSILTDPALV